jgi:histidine ammonia-lyase
VRSHVAAGASLLAPALIRAAMPVRLNQLGVGGAEVFEALVGAMCRTGDLEPFAEIASVLVGEGECSAAVACPRGNAWRGPVSNRSTSAPATARH